jgi:hypothetical protein
MERALQIPVFRVVLLTVGTALFTTLLRKISNPNEPHPYRFWEWTKHDWNIGLDFALAAFITFLTIVSDNIIEQHQPQRTSQDLNTASSLWIAVGFVTLTYAIATYVRTEGYRPTASGSYDLLAGRGVAVPLVLGLVALFVTAWRIGQ